MAKNKLSASSFVEHGYGQVEPNHLSAQRTGQIYAQLPMAESITTLENGQYVKYNYADKVVDFEGAGEWMLVYNEVKTYGEREHDDDFAMTKENGGVPRVFKTNVGDIYTTNMINGTTATLTEGKTVAPNATGILDPDAVAAEGMLWEIVKVYDLADGQKAVKLMRIQ